MDEYSVEYYRELNREETPQAKALAEAITDLYHPRTVVDLGCATGLYLAPFKQLNCAVAGYDISPVAFEDEIRQIDRSELSILDLRNPHINYLVSDVALCLEVVEHIGSEYADILVSNISQFSHTIVMTAAPPGQAGLNHVTCQPMSYWEEKFAKHGFKRDYHDECKLVFEVSKAPHTFWIIRNLMVFRR